MIGIVKKIDAQGFGIIDGADGSKLPFVLSDVMNRHGLEPGQKVVFSVRRVNDKAFAQNVIVMGDRLNLRNRALSDPPNILQLSFLRDFRPSCPFVPGCNPAN